MMTLSTDDLAVEVKVVANEWDFHNDIMSVHSGIWESGRRLDALRFRR